MPWLLEDALLYREARKLRVGPAELDELENWQIAELFGVNDTPQDNAGRQVRSGRDLVAERVAHERGRAPKPEPDAAGADVHDLMNRLGGQ